MKKHIFAFSITAVLGISLFLMPSCTETRFDLAEDYDFSAIDPVIGGLTGPAEFPASGLSSARYKVNARTGSTYEWTVSGGDVDSQTAVEGYPGWVDVLYSQSGVDISGVVVTVVETTSGGKKSEADTTTTDLKAFCPLTVDDFVGTWTGNETGDGAGEIVVTTIRGAGADEIVLEASAEAYPQLLSNVFIGWGETFQPGFGNEGDIILHLNELNGAITIELDYWGQTLPGPYDYWTTGGGSWSGCGGTTMTINFGLDWDETGTAQYESDVVLT